MARTYQVKARTDRRAITEFMKQEGQFLLPIVEFVQRVELAIDEVIDMMGRPTIEASERVLEELMEPRLDAWHQLVIYLDGIQFGAHHVLAAVGVDSEGRSNVLVHAGGCEREHGGGQGPPGGIWLSGALIPSVVGCS